MQKTSKNMTRPRSGKSSNRKQKFGEPVGPANVVVSTEVASAPELRSLQLDAMRGFAVLGIYWINVVIFALPHGAYAEPVLLGEATRENVAVWAFSQVFVEGTMRGLFSMLFGASALIFLSESRLSASGLEIVDRYFRRSLLLILFGLIHAYVLLSEFDVLYAYGLFGLFLFPLRNLKAKWLLIFGCFLLICGDIIDAQPDATKDSPVEVAETNVSAHSIETVATDASTSEEEPDDSVLDEMQQDIGLYRSTYWDIFDVQRITVAAQQSTYIYQKHVFDIGGMMLIGMALLKWGILTGSVRTWIYVVMLLAGYGLACLVRGAEVYQIYTSGFDPELIAELGTITYDIGRLPAVLGHIGLIGLICRVTALEAVQRALANVGRLALTNYVMQTVISIFLFYGFGLGLFGVFERYQLLYFCFAVWAFQIVFSMLWLRQYQFGPLEWLWRSLTFGAQQPFLRTTPL